MLEIKVAICFIFIYLSIGMMQLDKRVKNLEKVVKHHIIDK
ncbi:hypothetical protein [Clostridium niameyense]|nr:hypothetical protein [Clostridium niameyense]